YLLRRGWAGANSHLETRSSRVRPPVQLDGRLAAKVGAILRKFTQLARENANVGLHRRSLSRAVVEARQPAFLFASASPGDDARARRNSRRAHDAAGRPLPDRAGRRRANGNGASALAAGFWNFASGGGAARRLEPPALGTDSSAALRSGVGRDSHG